MVFLGVIGFLVVLAAIYAPQYWVGHTMRRHGGHRPDFPGTGGEMAQHLVERYELEGVRVEATEAGDHYDPEARVVRLSQSNFDGANLTAVAVAAHEVGHALQHHRGERGLACASRWSASPWRRRPATGAGKPAFTAMVLQRVADLVGGDSNGG